MYTVLIYFVIRFPSDRIYCVPDGAARLSVHMLFTVACNTLIPIDTVGNWLFL